MEKTCDYDICTGCGVCAAVCPKKCISFVEREFGHSYPKIDTAECIDCKLCERKCPALGDNVSHYPLKAFAGFSKNYDDYRSSTSGGAAHAIASVIISHGGVVYGCASLPRAQIKHIRVSDVSELSRIKGSKYVQSNTFEVFTELKEDVCRGIPVAYFGTPCQCAGVKALFREMPSNLLLVDLICHGVPSQSFLKRYLRCRIELDQVDHLSFRDGSDYLMRIFTADYKKPIFESPRMFKSVIDDFYIGSFFHGLTYRKSCYSCKYACPDRISDITVGDFWGLGRMSPAPQLPLHGHGISLILPNTSKGAEMMMEIAPALHMCERPVKEAIQGNSQLRHSSKRSAKVKFFNFLSHIVTPEVAYHMMYVPRNLAAKIFHSIKKTK